MPLVVYLSCQRKRYLRYRRYRKMGQVPHKIIMHGMRLVIMAKYADVAVGLKSLYVTITLGGHLTISDR